MKGRLIQSVVAMLVIHGAFDLAALDAGIRFDRDIRPVLSNLCFQCHGPNEKDRKSDLRLDVPDGEQGALTPRGDYLILKPGEPEESQLWVRITSDDEDEMMPPPSSHKRRLTEGEIGKLTRWIEEGAKYSEFWAFEPPAKSLLPKIMNTSWGVSPIDRRVMEKLEIQGLNPKPEADRRTLIRRLTFDLTGLPPTLVEIRDFLADGSPDAYSRLVDRLLGQHAYGEHMARYWADLVRLSDTNGMHKDFHRDFSSYRDWLIRSFNNNLPFDDFVKFQVAGDLYEQPTRDQLIASGFNRLHLIIDKGTALPEESRHKNIIDRLTGFGTTFLGLTVQCAQCHDHKYDPITRKDFYQLYAFFNNFSGEPETVRAPARGLQPPFINLTTPKQEQFLADIDLKEEGLDRELAEIRRRQEDSDQWPEKFEKVSVPWIWGDPEKGSGTLDFQGSLNLKAKPVIAMARFVGKSAIEVRVNGASIGASLSRDQGVAAEISDLLVTGENVITAAVSGAPEAKKNKAGEVENLGFAFLLEYRSGEEVMTFVSDSDWNVREDQSESWEPAQVMQSAKHRDNWTAQVRSHDDLRVSDQLSRLKRERKEFLETIPAAMIMAEKDPPREATILIGGAYDAPGDPVERNTPAFLPTLKQKEGIYSRLDLADWLVQPNHPLTARVAVNRFWQQFFGVGLVKTSEDFGAQGEWPSHPALLDDLSVDFVESGWDVKRLIRRIVMSNTYRQSSDALAEEFEADPENRYLARGSRFRMDAEMIRDQILAVSGQLNRMLYGKSVKPPQPPGLWKMVSMAEPFTYVADERDKIYRRSFYTYWRRGIPPPQMTIMNAPSREFCVTRRERTNTPLQALLLLNEQEYFKAARTTAINILEEDHDTRAGLSLAYEKITSHLPSEDRLDLMEETLAGFIDLYRHDPGISESLAAGLEDLDEDQRVELAAWTMMTHSLQNLELAKVRR